jgi:glycosyltransferase involved in cell wall biosynthesis
MVPVPDGRMAGVVAAQAPGSGATAIASVMTGLDLAVDVLGSSSDRRPIGIVAARYAPAIGGVELHVERLATGLLERGIPVEVLVTDATGQQRPFERRRGVPVRRFPTLRGGDEVYFVSPRLLRWLWRHGDRYRLLHAHGYHTLMPLIAGVAARRHGLPLVVTPHYHGRGHTPFRNLLHLPYRPLGGWALRRAAQVLANSLAEAEWLRRDFGDLPIRLNPNGVDLPTEAEDGRSWRPERSPGEATLVTVGRLERYKRVDRAIGALAKLPERYRLTVVGDGPEREALERRASRAGVADRIRFRGHVTTAELHGWYSVADAYLALSEDESFGMTLLEAASAGAPVVASDIPAHNEVSAYLPRDRVLLVPGDADDAQLARSIEAAVARGRSADRGGWQLPTWTGMIDGVVAAYAAALYPE